MKKPLLFTLCVLTIFAACRKDDDRVFDESADDRLTETLAAYQATLTGAENGWKALVSPGGGGTYFFYFKFNEQNRVTMYSTFDSASAVTPLESSYRLKALQQPSLIFDTYSYLHVLADPNEATRYIRANVNGGPVGEGLTSDFEYYFDAVSADTIRMVGRFHGSHAVLTRATKEEADAYADKQLGKGFAFRNVSQYVSYFKRVTIAGVEYEINVNQNTRTISFTWVESGTPNTFTTGYIYSAGGVSFLNPLVNGTETISGFENISWNAAQERLSFTVNGAAASVRGVGQPVNVDKDAGRRWWQHSVDEGDFWISLTGFHVNGVDDAFGYTQVSDFDALIFQAEYGSSGGVTYDLIGPILSNTLEYGYAFRPPLFRSDGRVIFRFYGTLGTVRPADETIGTNTYTQMADEDGYYFIQTGETTYDMVSAKDGKAWITWEF